MVRLFLLGLFLWACNASTSESTNHIKEKTQLKKQKAIQSIDCCLDSILKQLDTSLLITAVSTEVNFKGKKFKVGAGKRSTLNNEKVKNWIEEQAIVDSVRAFKIISDKEYYLLSSPIKQATGLAVNFTIWLVVDVSNNLAVEFKSLSANHQAFYFEKATQELHFIAFTFGESFIHQKDFENIVYRIENYKIDNGTKRLIEEIESRCICNQE